MGKQDELGYPEPMRGYALNLEEALEKVEPVRKTQFAKLWEDCIGVCMFGVGGVPDALRLTRKSLAQGVGWDEFSLEEAQAVGERATNLMRLIYGRRGFTKADDMDVSDKHLEPAPAGPAKGLTIGPYLPAMVDEYYRQMGWNVDTGMPTVETLQRLGMDEFLGEVS